MANTNIGPESNVADLEKALSDINKSRDELKDCARQVSGWLDTARVREEAAARVAAMSETEREALRQALGATGIQSEEAAGKAEVSE